MEWLYDWKLWLFIVTLLGTIINWLANQKLMNNHLHHIALDIKDIKTKQDDQGIKINNINNKISFLEGIKETENQVVNLLKDTLKNRK